MVIVVGSGSKTFVKEEGFPYDFCTTLLYFHGDFLFHTYVFGLPPLYFVTYCCVLFHVHRFQDCLCRLFVLVVMVIVELMLLGIVILYCLVLLYIVVMFATVCCVRASGRVTV